jgi:hypothetical protein
VGDKKTETNGCSGGHFEASFVGTHIKRVALLAAGSASCSRALLAACVHSDSDVNVPTGCVCGGPLGDPVKNTMYRTQLI